MVIVAAPSGGYGKPRPAVIVQPNAISENHAISGATCRLTSELVEADFRVTVDPGLEPTYGSDLR